MSAGAGQSAVVVGVDGSDTALGGLRWAADFAAGHALPLALLHVTTKPVWHFGGGAVPPESAPEPAGEPVGREAGDSVLAAAHAVVQSAHPDLEVRQRAVRGSIATILADASASARLLVIGAGAAGHRAVGGHAVRIAHRTQCPLVVWRPAVAKRTGKPLPVVVGVDESDPSRRALAEAFDVAAMLHAPLTVVHMWEIDAAVGMGDLGGQGLMDWPLLEVLQSQQRQQMDEFVEPFTRQYRNAHVNKVFQDVSPAKGLTELSREAQLVVVGSHGRGRIADAVLGSVSQNLIHHAECPVLVVR
jgi:nucleotide-binding universal stress UspA family protein